MWVLIPVSTVFSVSGAAARELGSVDQDQVIHIPSRNKPGLTADDQISQLMTKSAHMQCMHEGVAGFEE